MFITDPPYRFERDLRRLRVFLLELLIIVSYIFLEVSNEKQSLYVGLTQKQLEPHIVHVFRMNFAVSLEKGRNVDVSVVRLV